MRTVTAIDADLEAIRKEKELLDRRHNSLLREQRYALLLRTQAIIRDFDAGHAIKRIASDHDATVNAVWNVLRRSGRTAKQRAAPISHLPADQQRAYKKLRQNGVGPGAARQIATTHGAQ